MANRLAGVVSAVPETHTRRALLALGLDLKDLSGQLSAIRRNDEDVVGYGLENTATPGTYTNATVTMDSDHRISVLASGAAAPSAGNPVTPSVKLAVTNGVATTFMRSDAVLALDVSIVPTWTGIHTFSAQDVHNAGVSLGTSGVLNSLTTAGPSAITFDMNDTVASARTQGYARQLREGTILKEVVTWDGRYAFGYSTTLLPLTGHQLSFLADDVNAPAGAPIYVGILGLVSHTDTAKTFLKSTGLQGAAGLSTATGFSSNVLAGVVGSIFANADSSMSGKIAACFYGQLSQTSSAVDDAHTKDITFGMGAHPKGLWDHLTGLWVPNFSSANSGSYPTNTPAITSSARLTIQDFGAPTTDAANTKEYWSIYGENIVGADETFPAVTGYLRMTYPRRTNKTAGGQARGMHAWWEPWPNTATIRGAAAEGDTYFDDNTNFTGGLWEFSGIAGGANAWNYLLSSPGITVIGGAAPALLGTVGGAAGPVVAAQATWVQVNCADNVVRWIPAWV